MCVLKMNREQEGQKCKYRNTEPLQTEHVLVGNCWGDSGDNGWPGFHWYVGYRNKKASAALAVLEGKRNLQTLLSQKTWE